jgi:hypothetical protein
MRTTYCSTGLKRYQITRRGRGTHTAQKIRWPANVPARGNFTSVCEGGGQAAFDGIPGHAFAPVEPIQGRVDESFLTGRQGRAGAGARPRLRQLRQHFHPVVRQDRERVTDQIYGFVADPDRFPY